MSSKQATVVPTQAVRDAPIGRRIDGYFGVGLLRPGVGKLVQKTGERQYVGAMVCRLYGYTERPGNFNKAVISRRFAGEFFGIAYDGSHINSASGFVPSTINEAMKAALDTGAAPVSWAGEVWCEPDPEGGRKTPLGYHFVAYDRRPRGVNDPIAAMAAEAGIITADHFLPAPVAAEGDEVDPETGEITRRADTAA